jgi:flagellar biosynthetic protein FliR
MELLNFSPEQYEVFVLILIRVSVLLLLFPIFDSPLFPRVVKLSLALALTLALFPVVAVDPARFPRHVVDLLVLGISELFVGMVLGLAVRFFFAAVQLAGQMVGFQMGFSIINVLDPQTGGQVSIIDQIGLMVVMLLFLSLNGHHVLITALAESFRILAPGVLNLQKGCLSLMLASAGNMFALGIKIGAPAIVALLFTDAAFGICARFVPQMNILIAGFPIKIVVGLFFFGLTLQVVGLMTRLYLSYLPGQLRTLLTLMGTP